MSELIIAAPSVLNGRAHLPRAVFGSAFAEQEPLPPPLPPESWSLDDEPGSDPGVCVDCGDVIDPLETVDLDYCARCADFRAWYLGSERGEK